MSLSTDVRYLKQKGDVELKSGNYHQAWQHYTDALEIINKIFEIDKDNGLQINNDLCDSQYELKILSKRSNVLLKLKLYYYAHEDAQQIININPEWFKGYLRMANVELECGLYESSLKNYHLALQYVNQEQKEDHRIRYENIINQSIKNMLFMMHREKIYDYQLTWIGTAIGLVVGMAFVCWDFVVNRNHSYLNHPLIKLVVIGFCSFIFYYLTSLQRYFSRKSRQKLLQQPFQKEKIK